MRRNLILCSAMLLTVSFVIQTPAQQGLPTGKEVVERFVEVTGGRKKYEEIKTVAFKGKLSIPEVGIGGTIAMRFSAPDKMRVDVNLKGIGETKQGINGKVAWEISPSTGNRLMKSEEAMRQLESMSMKIVYAPESIFQSIKNTGVEEVDGSPCYKLEMKRKGSGDIDTMYYAVKTGLMVKAVSTAPSVVGKIEVETMTSDYRVVDGIKSAMKLTQKMPGLGMTQNIEIESVEYNVRIDDSVFEVPAQIKELLK